MRFPEERGRLVRLASSGEMSSLKLESQVYLGRLWESEVEETDVEIDSSRELF